MKNINSQALLSQNGAHALREMATDVACVLVKAIGTGYTCQGAQTISQGSRTFALT